VTRYLLTVDRFSAWVGKAFGWSIVLLTLVVGVSVIFRYLFRITTVAQLGINPSSNLAWPFVWFFDWAFDTSFILYGTLFMMAGAYTLAKNGHVRGDVLYGFFSPRTQATIDLVLYIVFFIPGVIALTYAGYYYAEDSWRINEHSNVTADGPPVYPFKTIIPVAGAFLLVQGIVEIIRCVICLKQGYWPSREADVEEVDVGKLKEELRVKDEDIEKLDVYVTKDKPQ
jgi:TRAP-type mannitol/chloroaromatic compound transport system permease small subunit